MNHSSRAPMVVWTRISRAPARSTGVRAAWWVSALAAVLAVAAPAVGVGAPYGASRALGQGGLGATLPPGSDEPAGTIGSGRTDNFAIPSSSLSVVRLGVSTLVGRGVTRTAIRRVLSANLGRVRLCHEAALARRPDFEGNLRVRFVVRAGGVVGSTNVDDLLGDPYVGACVAQSLRRLTFPGPRDGEVSVTQVFVLSRPRPR